MSVPRQDRRLKITIATLTRRRPEMLRRLIGSLGDMHLPTDADVRCLVVENDKEPFSRARVVDMNPLSNGLTVHYVQEDNLGIAFARNRAARDAIAAASDILVFVDDDEVVTPEWLVKLVAGYRSGGARLLGGPVLVAPPREELSGLQRVIHQGLAEHFRAKQLAGSGSRTIDDSAGTIIATSNWLAETGIFTDANIWFDESLGSAGGEDMKFYREVIAAGFPTGWVADALVYEEQPPARLTLGYQFRNARDKTVTNLWDKVERGRKSRWRLLPKIVLRSLKVVLLAIAIPFTKGKTFLPMVMLAGSVAGQAGLFFGYRSRQYTNVTGR